MIKILVFLTGLIFASTWQEIFAATFEELMKLEETAKDSANRVNPFVLKFDPKTCQPNHKDILVQLGIKKTNKLGELAKKFGPQEEKFENFLKSYIKFQIEFGLKRVFEINPSLVHKMFQKISAYRLKNEFVLVKCEDLDQQVGEGNAAVHIIQKKSHFWHGPIVERTIHFKRLVSATIWFYEEFIKCAQNSDNSENNQCLIEIAKGSFKEQESETIFHEYLHALKLDTHPNHNQLKLMEEKSILTNPQPVAYFLHPKIKPMYDPQDKTDVTLMHYNAYWVRHPEIKKEFQKLQDSVKSGKSDGQHWYLLWNVSEIYKRDIDLLSEFDPSLIKTSNGQEIEEIRKFEKIKMLDYHRAWIKWYEHQQKMAQELLSSYQADAVYSCSFYAFVDSHKPVIAGAMSYLFEPKIELKEEQKKFVEGIKKTCASAQLN